VGHFPSSVVPLLLFIFVFQSPQDRVQRHFQSAETRRRAGDLAGAEQEYKAVLAEGYGKLGKIYATEKKYQQAIDALESARLHGPESEALLIDLAIAYFDAEQYEKALSPSGKALSANPRSAGAHQMLGKNYFMLGDFDQATTE